MFTRQVPVISKAVLTALLYVLVYLLLWCAMAPRETAVRFIAEDLSVGDKYALIFLIADKVPVFSDADGANVFNAANCGKCFVTNNKGFLPLKEFDAVLIHALSEGISVDVRPDKRFVLETEDRCLMNKFRDCHPGPTVVSQESRRTFGLCQFCEFLRKRRRAAGRVM